MFRLNSKSNDNPAAGGIGERAGIATGSVGLTRRAGTARAAGAAGAGVGGAAGAGRKPAGFLRKACASLCSLALVVMGTASAFAYTTESFDVDVAVSEDNSYEITEKVKVNFDRQQHGIYVYIPESGLEGIELEDFTIKDQRDPEIEDEWVKDWNYEVYSEDGLRVFQIGDANETVTGRQTFEFGYRVRIVDDKDTTKDFMYLDLLPTGWETSIESTTIRVTMPKAVDPSNIQVYSGYYGTDTQGSNVMWDCDESGQNIIITGENLARGQGITIFAELPEGYWQGQLNYDSVLTVIPVLCVVFALFLVVLWVAFGRDKKIIPTVEFYPPEGLTPAEVGLIADGSLDKGDLVSMIIYFADKGYLAIEQKGKKDFILRKTGDIAESEKKFAKVLYDGIFEGRDYVALEDLGEDFGDAYMASYSLVSSSYRKSKNRQITLSSTICRILGIALSALMPLGITAFASLYNGDYNSLIVGGPIGTPVVILTLVMILSTKDKEYVLSKAKKTTRFIIWWGINILMLLVTGVMIYLDTTSLLCGGIYVVTMAVGELATCMMNKRTDRSIALMGKILGLRNFIEAAEADRINALVEENPSYYYDILPYAYVLGVTDKWAKNFEHIKIEQPSWYYGSTTGDVLFDAWFYSSMMRSCSTAITKNIQISTDSVDTGGGGFSSGGGGFTGGGFGGGGGGAW